MVMQVVAIDDNTSVNMITTQVADDIEVIYDLESKNGTIFYEDIEIECVISASILSALQRLDEQSTLLDKVKVLQQIERLSKHLLI